MDLGCYPSVHRLVSGVVKQWPEHQRFLEQSIASRDPDLMRSTERHAAIISRIIGESDEQLAGYSNDYRFLCDRVLEEEVHFRRTGRYRLSRFEDAVREVYADREFMNRYMNFLLLSHVLWDNHARAMAHFAESYLSHLPPATAHLEIGPGHGLLLQLACTAPSIASVTGWDVSQTSIAQTRHCLQAMDVEREVRLELRDLFDAPTPASDGGFGSVVLAEILEHLEDPIEALRAVSRLMRRGAYLWVHVPINSPAPDHLYLLRTPEEALALVRAAGFDLVDTAFFPMSGQTLERARTRSLTISAVITARWGS